MVKFIIRRKGYSIVFLIFYMVIIEKEISKRKIEIPSTLISLILFSIHNPLISERPVENSFISKKNPNLFRNQRSVSALFLSPYPREKRRDKKERSFPFPPYTDRNHRLANHLGKSSGSSLRPRLRIAA